MDFIKKLFGKKKQEDKEEFYDTLRLEPGEKVVFHKQETAPAMYKGRVMSVEGGNFMLDVPELKDRFPCPVEKYSDVICRVEREDRQALFKSTVEGIPDSFLPTSVLLKYPRKVQWLERRKRQFVRMEVDLLAKVRKEEEGAVWIQVRVKDLSLSGVAFISDEPYNIGEIVIIRFMSLNFDTEIPASVARVIREDTEDPEKSRYIIGMHFGQMSDVDKQTLANFTWEKQKRGIK